MLLLSKLIQVFVFPLGLVLLALLAANLLWRKRLGRGLAWAAVATLWIFSMPLVADAILQSLEKQYPEPSIESIPSAQVIIVLGDFIKQAEVERPVPQVDSNRLLRGWDLYRARKAPQLLLSGGTVSFSSAPLPSQSEVASQLLQHWGVPPDAIVVETHSRTTHENAVEAAKILEARGIKKAILVTSAFHLPRAMATFKSEGITAYPVGTDYKTTGQRQSSPFEILPDPGALTTSTMAIKEWIGLLGYRLKGWA